MNVYFYFNYLIGSCINYGLVWNGEYVFFDKMRLNFCVLGIVLKIIMLNV